MGEWAVKVITEQAESLARLRLVPNIEVGQFGDEIWLRGNDSDDALDLKLRSIPSAVRFRLLSDGQLMKTGNQVPLGVIPDIKWQPIREWFRPSLPTACWPANLPRRIPVRLVRSSLERECKMLMTSLRHWKLWTERAAAVRLKRLRFAVRTDAQVIIHGCPLPAIPGIRLSVDDGIAVPAGWAWSPAVEAAVLREKLELQRGDVALLLSSDHRERVAADEFVDATRAAVRTTYEEFGGE